MDRRTHLIIYLLFALAQLAWLIVHWRRHGFVSALKLFAFGVLACAVYELNPYE